MKTEVMDETQYDSGQSSTNGCAFRRSRRRHLRPKLKASAFTFKKRGNY